MLRALNIQNLILVEEAQLEFEPGLVVLSGETGAGKSAILKALGLILGDRAEARFIRTDADKARVEAAFDISDLPGAAELLEEAGIAFDSDEELIIQREISATGKSRAYINHQLAQNSLLRRLGERLMDLVGQHANQRLGSIDYHRQVVDLFGGLRQDAADFASHWAQLCQQKKELEELLQTEAERLREMDRCQAQIDELQAAGLKENEEEELFAEYTRLTHGEELSDLVAEVASTLQEGDNPLLGALRQCDQLLEKGSSLDTQLTPILDGVRSAAIELEEASRSLSSYQAGLESNPAQLATISERLTLLNGLKKRYGQTVAAINAYQVELEAKLATLEGADDRIATLQATVNKGEIDCDRMAKALTKKRKGAARKFEAALVSHLHPLNMKGASFKVAFTSVERTATGDERMEFTFAPNVGEGEIPLKQCASGGELSRVLLALKTALAGLELTPTLIFDEIDANLGGETGVLMGQKLKAIADQRQVLVVTHLPQVARQADQHFAISKAEVAGRTKTTVRLLNDKGRESELVRMLGGVDLIGARQ